MACSLHLIIRAAGCYQGEAYATWKAAFASFPAESGHINAPAALRVSFCGYEFLFLFTAFPEFA